MVQKMTIKDIPTDFKEWYDRMDEDTKLLSAYVGYLAVKRHLGVAIEAIKKTIKKNGHGEQE